MGIAVRRTTERPRAWRSDVVPESAYRIFFDAGRPWWHLEALSQTIRKALIQMHETSYHVALWESTRMQPDLLHWYYVSHEQYHEVCYKEWRLQSRPTSPYEESEVCASEKCCVQINSRNESCEAERVGSWTTIMMTGLSEQVLFDTRTSCDKRSEKLTAKRIVVTWKQYYMAVTGTDVVYETE